ncbi:MAG: hypothetical protein RL428_486 [Actinomycetota bacterium]|jgi:hypothetical protein
MNRKLWLSASLTSALILSSCGSSAGSYGDACPILQVHATEMAMVISSVPVAVDYDQRKEELLQALSMTSFSDLNSLRMAFNADVNSVLGFSGSLKPPTGEAAKTIEDLRTKVWNWDWTSVSSVEEVNAIMEGFAAIDEACSK